MNGGLHSLQQQATQVFHSLWKRRWLAVSVAWAVALISAPIVMLIPNRYEAAARIYVDTQTVLKPLMQGLAYTPDLDQQVQMLARTLISRPNIEKLVDKPELGLGAVSEAGERERLIARLMGRIKVEPAGAGNLYSITYRDVNDSRARRTVEATLELFVDAGSHGKKRDSEDASEFIDEQIKVYDAKLVEAENRLKEFKLKNFGVNGVASQDFFSRMSQLSEEVGKLRVDLASAEQAREAYRRELSGEDPQMPADLSLGVAPVVVSELDTRLQAQKRVLDEMMRRYTDEHPDVVSTRRVIAQLENQKAADAAAQAAAVASGKSKGVAATSPVYQKIRIALAETEAQVAGLRSQLGLKQSRLDEIRAAAGRVPQIEAELAQLNRDYTIINSNYQALVARRESASIGIKLDESSRLVDFRVVEPPRVLPSPVFPSRIHLAAIAILLAIASGIAAPLLLDMLFPTFTDSNTLQKATGRQVLGSVSIARTDERRRAARAQGFRVALACSGLLLVQGGWVLWLVNRTT